MYALMGVARMGATRMGYVSGAAFLTIGDTHVGYGRTSPTTGILIGSLSVTQELDETPDRCLFRLTGWVPPTFEDVILTIGSKTSLTRRFAGTIVETHQLYAADNPAILECDVSAVDYTWLLGFCTRVTARYRNQSASTIAKDLIATYAAVNGFTSRYVVEGLPALDEITYTEEDVPSALTRLARRIGAYWYVDYDKAVHFFFDETGNGLPVDLTPTHPSLADFTSAIESSQALTRVYVEGRGTRVTTDVPAGDTIVPVDSTEMFAVASDVFLKAAFQGSEGGAQYLDFTGLDAGGDGAIIGPGVTPSAAITATATPGAGIESGTHTYAYTWVTASGETLGSPSVSVSHGTMSGPSVAPWFESWQGPSIPHGGFNVGDLVEYAYATSSAANADDWTTGKSAIFGIASVTIPAWGPNPAYLMYPRIRFAWVNDPRVQWLHVYRRVNFGSWWSLGSSGAPNYSGWDPAQTPPPSNIYDDDSWPHSGHAPATPDTNVNQTQLAGIAVGASSVTARKVYRTAANQSQLKLLTTIANNTATTHLDAASDSTLGANIPVSDTAGLPQPAGQVNPGASAIIVTSTGAFRASGGWAVIGNGEQLIRYLTISGNQLLGISASGPGAVTAAVSYGSSITASPMVLGIPASGTRSIREPLLGGGELYLVVQVDDIGHQTQLAALVGGDGVREEWVQDRRLSIPEARARAQATLQIRPLGPQRLTYRSRDTRTAVGKTITVNLPAPTNVSGTFKIQRVTIDNFRPRVDQQPTFRTEAASGRFTFEDWLRRLRVEE